MDLDLSDRKYNILRKSVNKLHENCCPSLHALRKEKQKVILNITTTEISAEVYIKRIMQRLRQYLNCAIWMKIPNG